MKKKAMALVLALGLVVVGIVSGTMAWLTASSMEVKNTFTDSDISIVLDESKHNDDGTLDTDTRVNGNSNYKMIPGHTIAKDPMVTLDKDSEACYLFVQVTENLGAWSDNDQTKSFKDYLSYAVNTTNWTALADNSGVYYKKVDDPKTAPTAGYAVLKDNEVIVSGDNVTKPMMDEIDGVDSDGKTDTDEAKAEIDARPTLTFKAYAVQLYTGAKNEDGTKVEFTAVDAWAKAVGTANS